MIYRGVLVFFVLILSVSLVSAALGISPAKKTYNFEPGQVIEISYNVYSDSPGTVLKLHSGGDLGEYVSLSKDELKGSGSFIATLELPDELSPGPHRASIGARELPPEDAFIGTSVNIISVVDVFVPYPGRYTEVTLTVPDRNQGEDIPVETYVINRGLEDLTIDVKVDFYEVLNGVRSENSVFTMPFSPVFLKSGDSRYFRKFLNTTGLGPGDYIAVSSVDYGEVTIAEDDFRIGTLQVDIINFTESIEKGGLEKFSVNVESKWNDNIDEIYAEIKIIDNGIEVKSFRTPPVDLMAWESGSLEAYLDTSLIEEGDYSTKITIHYNGEETKAEGNLKLYMISYTIYYVIGILLILVLIALIVIIIKRRNHNKYVKYKKHVKKLK